MQIRAYHTGTELWRMTSFLQVEVPRYSQYTALLSSFFSHGRRPNRIIIFFLAIVHSLPSIPNPNSVMYCA